MNFGAANCMGCRKQAELNSLRAAVKRFEDGREIKNRSEELERNRRILEKSCRDNKVLTDELNSLRAE